MELYLSGLIGTANHPDMQKIRIIGFFFESKLPLILWSGKNIIQTAVLGHIFIYVQIKHLNIIPYMCFTNGGKF